MTDSRMTHEEYVESKRAYACSVAERVLSGELSMLEAARILAPLRYELELDQFDPDFMPFVAIHTQTDHLPLGKERVHWSREALAQKEPERQQAEEWAMSQGRQACRNVIERFKKG